MAYSNINKDKEQVGVGRKLKNAVFVGGLLIVTFSSIVNIYRQWTTLNEAVERNKRTEAALDMTIKENKELERLIVDASSSAYVSRKAREYFGLGTADDYWLILPKIDENIKFEEETGTEVELPNVMKWWNLFIPLR